jgi:hypothetical protein
MSMSVRPLEAKVVREVGAGAAGTPPGAHPRNQPEKPAPETILET